MYDATKVAFIDTETTGLHPMRCAIWEIAIIFPDTGITYHEQIKIDSFDHVDDWVKTNTRFATDYDYKKAKFAYEVIEDLDELFPSVDRKLKRHLVGACPWFDDRRLHDLWIQLSESDENTVAEHNAPWHYHLIDVETLMQGYLASEWTSIENKANLALPWDHKNLLKEMGIEVDESQTHTALYDAQIVRQIFEYIYGDPYVPD